MKNNNSKTNCIIKTTKTSFCTAAVYMLVCLIAVIALFVNGLLGKSTHKLSAMQLAERQKLSTYAELDENNKKAENCSFVEFSAFFTNDKDNQGNIIKRTGTCKRVNEKDNLYIDLNVLTNGYLENGQIVIEGADFVYSPTFMEDELINRITTNGQITTITLNKITAGTQKLILGEINSNINNINDYSSSENKITLTGTHISNDNASTLINVTRNVTVDWYGETEVDPEVYVYEKEMVYSYNSSEVKTIAVNFAVDEIKEELLLKNNYVEVEIPQLNNIAPENVICVNGGVASEYDVENRILKITKSSQVDAEGNLTNRLPYSNTYTIAVSYPASAFEGLEEGSKIDFNIKANYTAYNNPSAEFNGGEEKVVPNNTVTSNQATGVASIVFKNEEKIESSKINFSVNIVNKLYNNRTKVFGISKEALMQYYINPNEAENFKYTVEWDAEVRANSAIDSIKMSEIPAEVLVGETAEGKTYGDKFDENEIDKYVANTGIYFVGATEALGEEGKIFIYDNDTNELIYTFDASNWNTYNAQNPFVYTTANDEIVDSQVSITNTPVKHIKIETTAVANTEQAKVLRVFNIKELDKTLFKNDFTEEDGKAFIQNAQLLYTNIEGTARYKENTSVGGNETTEENEITVKAVDSAYLEQKVSFADISIEPKQFSTAKEFKNAEIRVEAKVENEFNSNWQNGKFIVEIPNEIIGVNINKVEIESVSQNGNTLPNSSVEIDNWELINLEDGKHIIKISTTNETPTTYVIKITVDVTADYRIGGGTKGIKLYAYNSLAGIYYNTAKDVYDINGNEAIDENIGGATTDFEIVSAQELITYETVTNYTKVSNEETQDESTASSETLGGDEVLAPNVAEINNEKGQATINVVLENKYNKSIENVRILGRIPFEGNKYVLKGDDLNSEFTSYIVERKIQSAEAESKKELIRVPEDFKDKAIIYYSDKEDANNNLNENTNNWKLLEDLNEEEIVKIKSYLIDLAGSKIDANKKYVFDYDVKVPDNVVNGKNAYSNHTVYYNLATEEGKLDLATEPTKVGIKIIREFTVNINTHDKEDGTLLNGAAYRLTWNEVIESGEEIEKSVDINSNEYNQIIINGLIEGKEYKLQQIKTPSGYMNNVSTGIIKAVNDEYGKLQVIIISDNGFIRTDSQTNQKDVVINKRNITIGVENEKGVKFTITKIDEENSNPIPNAVFDIYKIGNTTSDMQKIVTNVMTNEKGELSIWLVPGIYKAVETNSASSYELSNNIEERTRYFEIGVKDTEDEIYPINTIEDLVELSRLVNIGDESVKNKTIKLMKNLDFKSDSSYREYSNPETLKNLKLSLLSGNGFTPIGSDTNPFTGVFDGNGYEIRNIYVNVSGNAGLFGNAVGAQIKNVGLVGGSINQIGGKTGNSGGIIAYISDNNEQKNINIITNCYNKTKINGGEFVGGIVGNSVGRLTIANCYNSNSVSCYGSFVGGIIGFTNFSEIGNCSILNCYNSGELNNYASRYVGGIVGYINNGRIFNCYNIGDLKNCGGVGIYRLGYGDMLSVKNCYYLSTTAEIGAYRIEEEEGIIEKKTLEQINAVEFTDRLNQNINDTESDVLLQSWYSNGNTYPRLINLTDNIVITNSKKVESENVDYDAIVAESYEKQFKIKENKILKIDEETGDPIKGVVFRFQQITENGKLANAKKTDGEDFGTIYIERNAEGRERYYSSCKTTDSNGIIDYSELAEGNYKATEIAVPSNYALESNIEDRSIYFTVKKSKYLEGEGSAVYVYYIEDLIEIARNVNTNKTAYDGRTIYLLRDLNMDSEDSYRDSRVQSNYDYNKNGQLETLWDELHTEGCNYGLIPIGNTPYSFKGCFDGCGYSLINFKIGQNESTTGLFGFIQNGSVANIEIKGNTIVNGSGSNVGIIAGMVIDGIIENCCIYNSTERNIIETGYNFGGIVGLSSGKTLIKNCFNAKDFIIESSSSNCGGILGYGNAEIINCYNTGNIIAERESNIGGIIGGGNTNIVNCYNEGEIIGSRNAAGICGYALNNSKILNCYNKGHIKTIYSPAAGIYNTENNISGLEINNNYNIGLVEFGINGPIADYVGQITSITDNQNVQNCYYASDLNTNISQNGTGFSEYYMQSEYFVKLLNDNQQSIDTSYSLSKWILTDDSPTLENVGVISTGVDITKDYTYIISTAYELREFASKINTGEITGNVKVVLKNDIDLDNQEFTPIGNSTNPFKGVFEGNNHVIKNLYISKSTDSINGIYYAGLFGVVGQGSINNLGVAGKIQVSASDSSTTAGGIVGIANVNNNSLIINKCYSDVKINVNNFAGGIIGVCSQSNGKIAVYNSYNVGNVTGRFSVAGIVGYGINSSNIQVINCYNGGKIVGDSGSISGIANNSYLIENCINYGCLLKEQGSGVNYGISGSASNIYNSYYIAEEGYSSLQRGISRTEQELKSKESWQLLNSYIENHVSEVELVKWKYNACMYPTLELKDKNYRENEYLQVLNKQDKKECTIEIVKEDEDSNERLEGVEFKIEKTNSISEYSVYPNIGEKQYYERYDSKDFIQNGDIFITADNTLCCSSFLIDLTGMSESYTLVYDAYTNSNRYDFGNVYLNTESPSTADSKIKQSITAGKGGIYSIELVPNQRNYIVIYGRNFTVGNMKLMLNGETIDKNTAYNSKNWISSSNPYIEIDLTDYTDETYILELNASISSEEGGDYGYASITNSSNSNLSTQQKRDGIIYISGEVENKVYRTELTGGKKYYLHMGYEKNSSNDIGEDIFKINSITLKQFGDNENSVTDVDGIIKFNVLQGEMVKITETKPVNGYSCSDYTKKIIVDRDITLIVKNKKNSTFTINKIDEKTNEPIQDVKFAIYKVTAAQEVIEPAKYSNGNYIGTLEKGNYVVKTDENGAIKLSLPEGYYKAVEVQSADGYVLDDDENLRTIYFEIKDEHTYFNNTEMEYSEGTLISIENVDDWNTVASKVNSGEDNYEGKTIKLAKDIDFKNIDGSFITIGKNKSFKGNFDGNNHTIKNISSTTEKGLFGKIENSYIKNLTVENANFKTTDAINGGLIAEAYNSTIEYVKITGEDNIEGIGIENYGTVVGYAENTTLNKCSNERNIVINNTSGYQLKNVAGIAGKGSNVRIIECNNSGAISTGSGGTSNVNFVGIVGQIKDSGVIENCTNTGNITATTGEYPSGIIGGTSENVIINNCHNEADISGNPSANGIAYILLGGEIVNCDNSGTITSPSPASGILYRLDYGTIKNSHNSGYINCTGGYASGIVYQLNDSEVRDCYNEGKNEAHGTSSGIAYEANNSKIIDCYNKGELTKAANIVGIVGNSKNNSVILNCYNDAVINATTGSNAAGIVFYATDSTISNCYNNKDISTSYPAAGIAYTIIRTNVNNCYNTANITSNVPAGGIAYVEKDDSLIINCYNTGTIKSTSNSAGGLVNNITNSKIYNCYNNGNVIVKGDSEATSAGGILYSMNGTCEIANCYNSGTITTETENANTYGLSYKGNTDYFKNCYYIEGTANYAAPVSIAGNYEKITETKLKSELFVEQLNQNKLSLQNEIGIPLCNWSLDEVPILVSNGFTKDSSATITNRRNSNAFYILKRDAETGEILNGSEFATWKFAKNLSGASVSGRYGSDRVDKIEINLTDYLDDVLVKVNASQSLYSGWAGNAFAIITEKSEVPDYKNEENPFILISGQEEARDYSIVLKGGKKYYMHIGTYAYNSSNYTGTFKINSISLYRKDKVIKCDLGTNRDNNISISTRDGYSQSGYVYDNNYFTIDLVNTPMYEQYYIFNTNVAFKQRGMNSVGEAYCIITENNITPDYKNSAKTFFKLNGETEEKNYSIVLERGKKYYVHIGLYAKPGETHTGVLEMKDISLNALNTYTDNNCYITENKAPIGYEKSDEILYIDNKTSSLEILASNQKLKSYTITKIDEDTNQPIKGAKFAVYKVNKVLRKTENVVDINSNHTPEIYNDLYVYTTDENGQITISLPEGLYKAVEVAPADGYLLSDDEESRSVYFNIDEDIPGSIKINKQNTQTFEINYIEDLIELSNRVNLGETFEGVTVELKRDLDFKDKNSYMPIKTDEEKNNLINILTSTTGFIRIGSESSSYGYDMGTGYIVCKGNSFKGTFDGNNKKISNLYLKNGDACIGLFGQIEDACVKNLIIENPSIINGTQYCGLISKAVNSEIKNIKIIGNNTISFGGTNSGVLVGYSENCTISSCSNEINVDMYSNVGAGTIVGSAVNSKIISSHNSGQITNSRYNLGGIVGSATNNSKIKDCYNTGMISGSGTVGGIVYKIADSDIINCYNSGELNNSNNKAGIAYNVTNTNMTNCYNNGKITNGICSGIVFEIKNSKLVKCHNDGEIDCSSGAGLGYRITDCLILACYNKGNLKGSPICGIGYSINNSKIVKTHNEGKISGGYCSGFGETITNVVMDNCYNSGIVDSTGNAAGIANRLSGQINKTYDIANITGATNAQGIAYQIEGTITNVYNKGNITSSGGPANGIALELNGTLKNAYNEGNIQSRVYATGIVGGGTIENCVNTGNIKVTNTGSCAGIVINVSNVKNCYNLGKIECDYTTEDMKAETFASGIAQKNDGAEIRNCYYLDTSAIQGIYGEEDVPGSYEKITQADIESGVIANEINQIKSNCEQSSYRLIRYQEPVTNRTNSDMEYTLIVHHYLDNTEDKLEEDSVSTYHGGSNYSVEPSQELLKKYDLVKVVGHEEGNINEDTEVSYYYKLKEHNITTKVETPEGRVDKGGSITGDNTVEGNDVYEVVGHNQNSTKDITIEPKPGYRVAQIRVISTDVQGNETETIIYGENSDPKSEIKARKLRSGSMTLTNFVNVQEDKEIIVQFEPNEGAVLVHHYVENTTEKLSKDEYTKDIIGTEVETSPVDKERYVLVSGPEGEERTKTVTEELQEVTYYYQYEHRITTNVIEHTEKYKDGTVKTDVKGGTISGEDLTPYEGVLKGRDNTKDIVITPDDGYEIVKVTLTGEDGIAKDFDFKEIAKTNDKVIIDENGVVTIKGGFFENMQEDKHIEVEFRKKSKVIVKYLEEGTEKVLAKTEEDKAEFIQTGYEGKDFTTEHKIIPIYEDAKPEITIEDTEDFTKYDQVTLKSVTENGSKYAEGTMYADDITIIYWYKKIEADVVERHIEINEKKETTEIEHTTYTKKLEEEVKTNRNKYDGYIPVDGPSNSSDLVTVMKGTETTKTVTPVEGETVEVWYYYEKQFKITTEVKPHDETKVDETTGKETKVKVDGGTISKEYKKDAEGKYVLDGKGNKIEVDYEHVLNRGDATKEIVIIPDDTYRVKSITVNNKSIDFEEFKVKSEDGASEKVIIPETYFKDVQENKHVVVEFEKIPAKVIVKYIDIDTKEELVNKKVVEGGVKDPYDEPRVQVEGYVSAGKEPSNSKGTMTEEPITIIYYYTKEFMITTEVKQHEELEEKSVVDVIVEKPEETEEPAKDEETTETGNNSDKNKPQTEEVDKKVMVKGGTITGELTQENQKPIEIVLRGKDSTKEVIMKPEKGYRIKSIKIIEGDREGAEDDNSTKPQDTEKPESSYKEYEIDIKELLQKDGTAKIPAKYFTNVQSDKHIIVEYERIPSKVIVNYLEKGTEAVIADQEVGEGFVDYEYVTHEKEIPYYELLKDEMPENAKGILVEEDTVVDYWYRRLLLNMSIKKEFTSILVNDVEALKKDDKVVKIDIANKDLNTTNITVKYKLTIANTEEIAGKAKIIEQIPVGFKLSEKTQDKWKMIDKNTYELITDELKPGDKAEYEVILEWDTNMKCIGTLENIAKVDSVENEPNFSETTLEDNKDTRTLIVSIRTGKDRTIKLIISYTCYALAAVFTFIYLGREISFRKRNK